MYEIAESWRPYFEELDPRERLKRFNSLAGREDSFQKFCRTVYQERYCDPKHPDRLVDTWLWKFVYLPGLYRRRKWMGKSLKKEMEKTAEELHLARPEDLGDMERAVLYLEFRNAARRYFSTCAGPRYASSFLGLKQATPEEKRTKACEDIWIVSRGLSREAGMEERFPLWSDALRAELALYDPDSWKRYEQLERNSLK